MKTKKPKKNKLELAIEHKERAIRRKREKIVAIKLNCEEVCREIKKLIPRDQYILDGLKSGALTP